MRRDTLTIQSVEAGRPLTKTIWLRHVTGIQPTALGDAIAVVYHGDPSHLYLNEAETIDFINVTWSMRNCPYYRKNACWGSRQVSGNPPDGCIGCRLRYILKETTREDMRASLEDKPRSPLFVAFWPKAPVFWLLGLG